LRQPLEDGVIVIGRASGRARFPTETILVGAMNPCPCGWQGSGVRPCTCPPGLPARYRSRISGPLLDRFDLRVVVKPVPPAALLEGDARPEPIDRVALRTARVAQAERARRLGLPRPFNARVPPVAMAVAMQASDAARAVLAQAALRYGLSGRGIHRTLRVARTIADLKGAGAVEAADVGEALQYRGDDA
jgi:magnesium chelatase family protein